MRLINYALTLVLCLSLAILPALGTEGFPKTIVDSANRTLILRERGGSRIPHPLGWG